MTDIINGIKRTVKNITKPFLMRMVKVAINYPWVATFAKRIVRCFPWVEVRLKRLYFNQFYGQINYSVPPTSTFNIDGLMLPNTIHVKQIFEELKKKLAQRNETV